MRDTTKNIKTSKVMGKLKSKIRYYVHGDSIETDPEKYYCSGCDLFGKKEHFSGECRIEDQLERYSRSIVSWKQLHMSTSGKYIRPAGCFNLFASMKAPKVKTSPFYNWLVKQTRRDDIIGDLACDILRDRKFPKEEYQREKIASYIRLQPHSCNEALGSLDEAWTEFKKNKKSREGISSKLRYEILKRDNFLCNLCGQGPEDNVKLEIDHKIPVAKSGDNNSTNLWVLCFQCNRGKGTDSL